MPSSLSQKTVTGSCLSVCCTTCFNKTVWILELGKLFQPISQCSSTTAGSKFSHLAIHNGAAKPDIDVRPVIFKCIMMSLEHKRAWHSRSSTNTHSRSSTYTHSWVDCCPSLETVSKEFLGKNHRTPFCFFSLHTALQVRCYLKQSFLQVSQFSDYNVHF